MDKQITIVIADDERNICEMLKKLIMFDELGLSLVGVAANGEELQSLIMQEKPQIVVTDISMPKMDGLEVIRWCRENDMDTHFVVLSGYHQFEYAYNALKYRVNDYLLKPVNEDELNRTLKKIIEEINSDLVENTETQNELLHYHFMQDIVRANGAKREVLYREGNLAELNKEYMLNLQEGSFRVIYLELDDFRKESQQDEDISSVLEKVKALAYKRLREYCYEILSLNQQKAVKIFINYNIDADEKVKYELKNLFDDAKSIADVFSGMHFTLCVSDKVDSISDVPEAENQAYAAAFSRLGYGTDRIIYFGQLEKVNISSMTEEWSSKILRSWEILSEDDYKNVLRSIFTVSSSVRCSADYALYIRKIPFLLLSCKKGVKDAELDAKVSDADELTLKLEACSTYDALWRALSEETIRDFRHFAEYVDKKNTKPIRQACDYVSQHYGESIRLEDVAEAVKLSPSYFSTLFAKKTGQNFSDYVTSFKMKKACEMLSSSDMNINEIADKLGFPDSRYFSKLFRKNIGIKPTEYRKIYG